MPVIVSPDQITQPASVDLGNSINDNLIALFSVKNGEIVELLSNVVGVGSTTIINDSDGTAWKGPVTFNLNDLAFDLSLNRKISYQVLGKFNADNTASSDESFVDFRTVDDKYLKISANGGWNKFYPKVSGAWVSMTDSSLTVTHGQLTTIGGTLKRKNANSYDTELFKNGTLTNSGNYAQASSANDLVTLTIGNNDEPIYFVAIYEDFRTLEQFNEVDLNPNQVFINSTSSPSGVNYLIDPIVAEQTEVASILNVGASFDVNSVAAEQIEDAVNIALVGGLSVTSSSGEQVEQGQVLDISTSFDVNSVAAEQIEDAVNIALAGGLLVTSSSGEQVEQGQVLDISTSFDVNSVAAEQIEDAVNIVLAGDLSITSLLGEQLEQAKVIKFYSEVTVKFLLDEKNLRLIKTTPHFLTIKTTLKYNIKKV